MTDPNGNSPKKSLSLIVCVYGRKYQFENFLISLSRQARLPDQFILVDNGTPGNSINELYDKYLPGLDCNSSFFRIDPKTKTSYNGAYGLNFGSKKASGEYVILLTDSNVIFSDNLVEEVGQLAGHWTLVTSYTREYRTSPDGTYKSEYSCKDEGEANQQCKTILESMGWPCDVGKVDLNNKYIRDPTSQLGIDSYLIALKRSVFLESGGYSEEDIYWGRWSVNKNLELASHLRVQPLKDSRIVHQFHHMTEDNKARFTPQNS